MPDTEIPIETLRENALLLWDEACALDPNLAVDVARTALGRDIWALDLLPARDLIALSDALVPLVRVPCRCGDGTCMLCDDTGMVPID